MSEKTWQGKRVLTSQNSPKSLRPSTLTKTISTSSNSFVSAAQLLEQPPTAPLKINYRKETLAKRSFKELQEIGYTIKRSKSANNFGKFFYYNTTEKSFYAWVEQLSATQYHDWHDSLPASEKWYWEQQNIDPFDWMCKSAPQQDEEKGVGVSMALENDMVDEAHEDTRDGYIDPIEKLKMAPKQNSKTLLPLTKTAYSFLIKHGFDEFFSPENHCQELHRLVTQLVSTHSKDENSWEIAYHALLCYVMAMNHYSFKAEASRYIEKLRRLEALVCDPLSTVPGSRTPTS
jgi:hypothetical protein